MSLDINNARLAEIREANDDVVYLVDFWAEWCGPCIMMGPVLSKLAEELKGDESVEVLKFNVESGEKGAMEDLGIKSIPTMIFFKNGEEVERLVGTKSKEELLEKFENHK